MFLDLENKHDLVTDTRVELAFDSMCEHDIAEIHLRNKDDGRRYFDLPQSHYDQTLFHHWDQDVVCHLMQ